MPRNLIIALAVTLLLIAIPATVFLVRQQQNLRPKADVNTVTLSLSPATNSTPISVGQEFEVDLKLNAGTFNISSVDVLVNFNKDVLNVVSVDHLNNFSNKISNNFDNNTGTIRYRILHIAQLPPIAGDTHSGVIDLAKIKFRAVNDGPGQATFGATAITALDQDNFISTANNIEGNYIVTDSTQPAGNPSPVPVATVTIEQPSSTATYQVGNTLNIAWTANIANQVPALTTASLATFVSLTNGNSGNYNIICNISNTEVTSLSGSSWSGDVNWTIPASCINDLENTVNLNGQYYIRVTINRNLTNGSVLIIPTDFSDVITIQPVTSTASPSASVPSVGGGGPCALTETHWETPNNNLLVNRGTTVTAVATATGDCTGKAVYIEIDKANGARGGGEGCQETILQSVPFDSSNKATGSWVTTIASAIKCGEIVDGGPIQYSLLTRIVTQQIPSVSSTTNLKVREGIPNKVRVINLTLNPNTTISDAEKLNVCNDSMPNSTGVQTFNYPTSGKTFAEVSWNLTSTAGSSSGPRLLCAQFGYKPSDSNVIDYQSYPPTVYSVINYQQASPSPSPSPSVSPSPSSSPSMTASCTQLFNLLQSSLGSSCGSSTYNKVTDLNRDKRVDILDFSAFRSRSSEGTDEQACVTMLNDPTDPCQSTNACTPNPKGDADGNTKTEVLTETGLQGDFFIWKNAYIGAFDQRADFDCNGRIEVLKENGTQGDFFIWKNGYLSAP